MPLEINEAEINDEEEVEPEKTKTSFDNDQMLTVILIVLFFIMLGSGFLMYKFVLAGSAVQKTKVGPIYETEEFVVNFSGSLKHFLKVQFALELSNKKVITELEEKKPLLLDTINMILLTQTKDVLMVEGREALKNVLCDSINEFLDTGYVEKIHYLIFLLT